MQRQDELQLVAVAIAVITAASVGLFLGNLFAGIATFGLLSLIDYWSM